MARRRHWALLCAPLLLAAPTCSDDKSPQAGAGAGKIVISEIMYHPVLEGASDDHEFVELQNAGTAMVDLSGYRLSGGVRFTFAAGTTIAPGSFVVVARRRDRLLAVSRYRLVANRVVGDFSGSLSNDGDTVVLERGVGAATEVVDKVTYDDAFPWPASADALGTSESFLAPENLPLSNHQFMGRSLERRSPSEPGDAVSNWVASPLDGATPGRAPAESGALVPTVVAIESVSADKTAAVNTVGTVIAPDQPLSLHVRITPDAATATEIEYFIDDRDQEGEPLGKVALVAEGDHRTASLPAFPAGTLVRYRILGDRGHGAEVLSPRPEDPQPFYSAYAAAPIAGQTPTYQLIISKARWEKLWDNIIDGRVPLNVNGGNPDQCEINPAWDARVPAVLVLDGGVYDIQARYQGSRTNRTGGPRLLDKTKWPAPGVPPMSIPAHVQTPLSWHFTFPRHARPVGHKTINLNKLTDASCQGFFATVGNILFQQAGIPAAETSYARLYINGSYYHYMQNLEHVDEDLLTRAYGPGHKIGDLFKSVGVRWDEGPFGFGDEGLLHDYCGYSAQERYDATYERQSLTDEREGSREVREMLEAFHAARAQGDAAVRAFFNKTFDVDLLTNYLVVRNWLGAWDDVWQNHFLYRRADGRWMIMPTDLDNHFGFSAPSAVDASFFAGVENGRSNFRDLSNPLKDSFLRVFRAEFLARLRELSGSVLHPSNVLPLIDEAVASYSVDEARDAPAGLPNTPQCGMGDPVMVGARMKAFVRGRYERVLDGLFD
jgi:hypothetical protein